MPPRGSQPTETESPRHRVALGQLAHAGQISADTQSPHLPQRKHLFPRQASLTPSTACWGKGTKVRRVRLEPRKIGSQKVLNGRVAYLNVHFSDWHIINVNGSDSFLQKVLESGDPRRNPSQEHHI